MVKYKMTGKDMDMPPCDYGNPYLPRYLYRTWIVNNSPDYSGAQYSGPKSGNLPLEDVLAYIAPTDGYYDFNYPELSSWGESGAYLPNIDTYYSQVVINDGYAYLLGGVQSNDIYKASINNPLSWAHDGYLNEAIYGSQSAIIDGYTYLFGGIGSDGYYVNSIYYANISAMNSWTKDVNTLPITLAHSQLAIIDGYIYLFGGETGYFAPTNSILRASITSPKIWTNIGYYLPDKVAGSQVCVLDGYVYLIGGIDSNKNAINKIYKASKSNLTSWSISNTLPIFVAFGQIVVIGDEIYYLGGYGSGGSVLKGTWSNSGINFTNLGNKIPGTSVGSQAAIIYDKVYLFGGNGNTSIYCCGNYIKYSFTDPQIQSYGLNKYNFKLNSYNSLFQLLGFAPWKVDYGS